MKFLGRDPPESSLPASDRAPSEGEGETGGTGRIFSIFPAHHIKHMHLNTCLLKKHNHTKNEWFAEAMFSYIITGMYIRQ